MAGYLSRALAEMAPNLISSRCRVWIADDHVVVDRSTTWHNSDSLNGNWVDRIAALGTGVDQTDEKNHLAKVRVAGSNPVVRSKRTRRSSH